TDMHSQYILVSLNLYFSPKTFHLKSFTHLYLPILGGNAPGKSCAFPFFYNKQIHYTCISDGESSEKLWCSTTRNYDVDKKWTYCSTSGKPCVFPFIYKKFKFHTCTNLAEASGKFWCSSTENYYQDHQWSYCPA
uniref:Fibronectin type-II domain-containing protein n=1 Tax=Chelonoidis abingdonii TaxID=106734 RepID=A0A8C0H6K9_CHEAB